MPIITVGERKISCQYGDNLLAVLQRARVFFSSVCNGMGTCGKCKVYLCKGNVGELSQEEKARLKKEEQKNSIRLACLVSVKEDLWIEPLEEWKEREEKGKILTQGFLPKFIPDKALHGYGLAVDIGTTTVIMALVDLETGNELGQEVAMNPQRAYGHDVLSRITYEIQYPEDGKMALQKGIVATLNEMIQNLCRKWNVAKDDLGEMVVAANCTMMHMLLGEDATSLGVYPYKPGFVEARSFNAANIGLLAGKNTKVYCLPQVSAFIGADIVAGAYVCELKKKEGNVLFIDIGTNGEMVLSVEGKLYSCSCAAGPALEGMNISHGMMAGEGAIEEISIAPEGIRLSTIGNREPLGLCGSGILAVARELLRTKIIKPSGVLIKPEELEVQDYRQEFLRLNGKKREIVLWSREEKEILVTQDDLRQVQLAKGALLSGCLALLQEGGIEIQDLDEVIIAGQFGAHLSGESLTEVGIVPKEVLSKLTYVGNSSKSGAYMALMSSKAKGEMEALATEISYMELADKPDYQDLFMNCMKYE